MFDVVNVPRDARDELEEVGSKAKFWFKMQEDTDEERRWLFKQPRRNEGEDWSEKIAAELADMMDLPHAIYEFAEWNGNRGVITPQIEDPDERLTLGDEFLSGYANRYRKAPETGYYINPQYTLDLVFEVLTDVQNDIRINPRIDLPNEVGDAFDLFVGYLLLDAWIGNTDRHDQNWGVVERNTSKGVRRVMAPTFDHASCLGREVPDEKKKKRMTTNDQGFTVEAYARRCPSRFVKHEGSKDTLHPISVFEHAADKRPRAADAWRDRLRSIPAERVESAFRQVPEERISEVSIKFALRLLDLNSNEILNS